MVMTFRRGAMTSLCEHRTSAYRIKTELRSSHIVLHMYIVLLLVSYEILVQQYFEIPTRNAKITQYEITAFTER